MDVGQYRGTAQSSERRRYVAFIYSLSRATIPSKNRFYIGEVVTSGFEEPYNQRNTIQMTA
jgi:hypothetical protein